MLVLWRKNLFTYVILFTSVDDLLSTIDSLVYDEGGVFFGGGRQFGE